MCRSIFPFRVMNAKEPLEWTRDVVAVQQFDLLDEAVEAEPHRRIADVVDGGQLLERPGRQDESLDEGQVLVL